MNIIPAAITTNLITSGLTFKLVNKIAKTAREVSAQAEAQGEIITEKPVVLLIKPGQSLIL